MNKYIKVEKFDEYGDLVLTYLEPYSAESVGVAVETELLDDGEVGEYMTLTIVEMEKNDFEDYNRENGY